MKSENFKKAAEIQEYISVINSYLNKFNPDNSIVHLQVQDSYGNKRQILDLYAHGENQLALGYKYDNFCDYYKEFLKKCTDDLGKRKLELEQQFEEL